MPEAPTTSARGSRRAEALLARRGGAVELLRVPAALYGAGVWLRATAYDLGWLTSARADVPVVSIGNVSAGGTGKTPACAWAVGELAKRGFRPGLLSRGYGAAPGAPNDEAAELAALLPGVLHVQDPARARGAAKLVAQGVDAIVLDDGFQHRRLARDVDLVLVDATRPWGLPRADGRPPLRALLPRGLLREAPAALARADALVITRADQAEPAALSELVRELGALAPGKPIARAVHAPRAWRAPDGTERPIAELAGREVDVVSALGNPEALERSVRALGLRVREHRVFPDHHRYEAADLAGLGGALPLVASGKDAVKLAPLRVACWTLAIEFRIESGAGPLAALFDGLPRGELPPKRSREVRRG